MLPRSWACKEGSQRGRPKDPVLEYQTDLGKSDFVLTSHSEYLGRDFFKAGGHCEDMAIFH